MAMGYLLGGMACILYFLGVGILGGIKKSPGVLKLVKMKLGKSMSDEKAAKICLIFGSIIGAVGVFLFILGALKG